MLKRLALQRVKKRGLYYKWNWQLSSEASALWPIVSNTNRLFKDLNLPAVQLIDIAHTIKKGRLQLSYNSIKYSDAWVEEPFEWEYPFRYGVKRIYKNGSYKELRIQVDLFPNQYGTRLQFQVWAKPQNRLISYFLAIKLKGILQRRLKYTFKQYDEMVCKGCWPYEVQSRYRLSREGASRLREITEVLIDSTDRKTVVEKLVDFILHADDIDLVRIRPYELADHWGLNREEVLQIFLFATKEGLLNFNWDLHCPTCRIIQQTCRTLNDVHKHLYCHECSEDFSIKFDESVQLSFRPNPLIRKISTINYCMGGPQHKPHIMVQQLIKPHQKKYLKTKLDHGVYHLRNAYTHEYVTFFVGEHGQDTIHIQLTPYGLSGESDISDKPNLVFENSTSEEQLFIIEKAAWSKKHLTAAQVTSHQLFRDLFDEEILRKGEKIVVDKLTLMFTDLFDSTKLYHREGDSEALGQVIEHFDVLQQAVAREGGALVKTIGDSIMAVFSNPMQAFRAFINAQQIIAEDHRFGDSLKLKAGIHHGSCMAVSLNNRIDYFGLTVNIASRLVDLAEENEIVISEDVSYNPLFRNILNQKYSHYTLKNECANLKGFDTEVFNIERIQLQRHNLRLVI